MARWREYGPLYQWRKTQCNRNSLATLYCPKGLVIFIGGSSIRKTFLV